MSKITISTTISAPVEKVWEFYTKPEHIVNWNNASEDWHTTRSVNDLVVGGKFLSRMESVDGKEGFDFSGVYSQVELYKIINYSMDDGRVVEITFIDNNESTDMTIIFDAEEVNSLEMQQMGWQAILDNFKNYVEKNI